MNGKRNPVIVVFCHVLEEERAVVVGVAEVQADHAHAVAQTDRQASVLEFPAWPNQSLDNRSIEFADVEKFLAQFEPPRLVHVEHGNGRSARGRQSDNLRPQVGKMLPPTLLARAEKSDSLSSLAVYSAEIGRFREIAPNAGPRQIICIIRAAVLSWDNVFDLVTPKQSMFLTQAAVFALVVRPFPDSPACLGIH